MITCTACTYKNLPGADMCEECGTPLASLPKDATELSKRNLSDSIQKAGMRNPVVVSPKIKAKQVLNQMKQADIGCALIVENGRFLGIFTERDVLHRLAKPGIDLDDIEIQHVMTPTPNVLKETESVSIALNIMAMGNFRHVPVQLADGTYSVFSVRDALRYFF